MTAFTCIRISLALLLLCGASLLRAKDWTVQTLPSRLSPTGQNVTLAIAVYPAPSRVPRSVSGGRGKGHLLLQPPIEGDGHHIYHKPELWRAALKDYLNEIGVVTRAN